MKCRRCEYPLWNLKDRRCPECGQDFLPSQYQFVPRAVRFCCPHCQQQYFGTGVDGHLVPRSFDCVSCGVRIDMDETVLSPADGAGEGLTATLEVAPWVDGQRRRRFLARYFITLGGGLGAPKKHIERVPIDSSVGAALWFATFTALIVTLASVGTGCLFMGFAMVAATGGGAGGTGWVMAMYAIVAVAIFIGILAWLMVWMLTTHIILAVTGKTAGGLRRTVQCMSYASAPNILYVVPCLNFYLWPVTAVWSTISGAIMIKHGQKVSTGRAVLAVSTPPVVLGAGLVAFVLAVLIPAFQGMMVTMANAASQAVTTLNHLRAQKVSAALNSAAVSNAAFPAHAVELLDGGLVTASDFALTTNPMASSNIPVGKTTLGAIELLSPAARAAAIKNVVDSQPAGVIAHRVGDYVFSYHGINPTNPDPGLWMFVAEATPPTPPAPPPSPSGAPTIQTGVAGTPVFIIGLPGGQVETVSQAALAGALAQQNQLRSTFGLPALPDPTTITSSSPVLRPK
jgi:hypothetical protein